MLYEVKWFGYSYNETSWEPATKINDSDLAAFEEWYAEQEAEFEAQRSTTPRSPPSDSGSNLDELD